MDQMIVKIPELGATMPLCKYSQTLAGVTPTAALQGIEIQRPCSASIFGTRKEGRRVLHTTEVLIPGTGCSDPLLRRSE